MDGGGCSHKRLSAGLSGVLRCVLPAANLASMPRCEAVA
jgi:hypothetical protein